MKKIIQFITILFPIVLFSACGSKNKNSSESASQLLKNSTAIQNISFEGRFCLENPPLIDSLNSLPIYEGGFSALLYIPNSDMEFYVINDRGVNLEITDHPKAKGKNVKYFPFPNYHQKIFKIKIQDAALKILNEFELNTPDGSKFTGVNSMSGADEEAWVTIDGKLAEAQNYFMDAEGLTMDKEGNFWVSEEYGPSLLSFDAENMKLQTVLNDLYTIKGEAHNSLWPSEILKKRAPNRGFEGLTYSEDGYLYAILQSPLLNPDSSLFKNTQLIRILKYEPKSGKSQFLLYETGRNREGDQKIDWKIGDVCSIDSNHLVVIEHGVADGEKRVDLYLLDLSKADTFSGNPMFDGKTIEQLQNGKATSKVGIKTVTKTHLGNLVEAGFSTKYGKPEGIAFINDQLIAIVNDNDYGVDYDKKSSSLVASNIPTCIHLFKLPKSIHSY